MASFNKVIILGNLTRDPEIKYTPKGTAIADFGLAVNRHYTTESGEKREEVTFIDITLWGRTAEIVGEYCHKGDPLHVEGRLQLDQWDDKATGQKRQKLKVIGDNIQLLNRAPAKDREDPRDHAKQRQPTPASRPKPPADPDLDAPDDDIPF